MHQRLHLGALREEGNAQHGGGMALKGAQAGAITQGPEPQGLDARRGCDALVPRGKLCCPHPTLMAPEDYTRHQVRQAPHLPCVSTHNLQLQSNLMMPWLGRNTEL